MELVDASTAEAYLRRTERVDPTARVEVERLAGGVSNEVLLISVVDQDQPPHSFVIKQARPQLRTPQPWFCTVERIWRETSVLNVCQQLAEPGQIPRILFEDRANYLFAMTAAPRHHRTWKADLLSGTADPAIARACGRLLGALHAGSWRDPQLAVEFADQQLFDELRIDPYYRTVARTIPSAAPALVAVIESLSANPCALVHADFSPKNVLLFAGGLMLVDYETGHFGDPAFDLGFFFSHLFLKTFYHAPHAAPFVVATDEFWQAYQGVVEPRIPAADFRALADRWTQHLGACIWSRLDGKSQVEYLSDEQRRAAARELAQSLVFEPRQPWPIPLEQLKNLLAKVTNP